MSEAEQTMAIIGAIVFALTNILTLIFTLMERARSHRQRIKEEDYKAEQEQYRVKLATDLDYAKKAADLAAEQAANLQEIITKSKEERAKQIEGVKMAIDENTKMNKDALDAANGVNGKIESLGIQVAEQRGEARAQAANHMEAANVTIEAGSVEIHSDKPPQ